MPLLLTAASSPLCCYDLHQADLPVDSNMSTVLYRLGGIVPAACDPTRTTGQDSGTAASKHMYKVLEEWGLIDHLAAPGCYRLHQAVMWVSRATCGAGARGSGVWGNSAGGRAAAVQLQRQQLESCSPPDIEDPHWHESAKVLCHNCLFEDQCLTAAARK